ncbi:MAG: mechanosensitive ion channel domain-containing protein [Puniceicoccaceae bacterium]
MENQSTSVFSPEQLNEWLQLAIEFSATYGIKIILAIVLFLVGKRIASWLSKMTKNALTKGHMDPTLVSFVGNIVNALLLAAVVIAVLDVVGIQTTSLVAVIGAAGLAIGLALQGSLANFASGVMLIIFRPFRQGDFITAGGESGIVEEVTLFTTSMRTPDNKAIIIPNAAITSGSITNFSAKPTRRVDLVYGVSYNDDLKKVKEVIWDVLNADERILKDPAPTVGLLELADSSVNFAVRPWVNASDYWAVYFDLNETIKLRFDQEGISIPFPQRDVHLFKSES